PALIMRTRRAHGAPQDGSARRMSAASERSVEKCCCEQRDGRTYCALGKTSRRSKEVESGKRRGPGCLGLMSEEPGRPVGWIRCPAWLRGPPSGPVNVTQWSPGLPWFHLSETTTLPFA